MGANRCVCVCVQVRLLTPPFPRPNKTLVYRHLLTDQRMSCLPFATPDKPLHERIPPAHPHKCCALQRFSNATFSNTLNICLYSNAEKAIGGKLVMILVGCAANGQVLTQQSIGCVYPHRTGCPRATVARD